MGPQSPSVEPVPFFVAWDSTVPKITQTLQLAVDRGKETDVRFLAVGYKTEGTAVGSLRNRVMKTIEDAHAVIAVVDKPNATVGWELGYGLARGKPLALARCTALDLPEWTRFGLLRGQLSTPATVSVARLVQIARQLGDFEPPPNPVQRGGRTLLFCPDEELGPELLQALPGATLLDLSCGTLADLPTLLHSVARAAWVIPEPGPDQVRDGSANGLLGIAAGFLEGCSVPVRLFLHQKARDQQHLPCRAPYGDLDTLLGQLAAWEAESRPGPTGAPPAPPTPLEAWRLDTLRQHSHLLPFIHDTMQHGLLSEQVVALELLPDEKLRCLPEHAGPERAGFERLAGRRVPLRTLVEEHLRSAPADTNAGRWLVVAEPGAGKTTLARHLAWSLANDPDGDRIPLYVPLAELTREKVQHPFTWAGQVLHADDGRISAPDLEAALHAAAAERGRVWLLLDGLDEVAGARLEETRRCIGTWAEALPGVVFVVLCRPTAADAERPPPGGFHAATVAPLSRTEQIELARSLLPEPLVQRLRDQVLSQPRIQVLATNPLLLTLVAIVAESAWEQGADTPRHRLELYDQAVELFLVRGWGRSGSKVKDEFHARYLLEELALELQRREGEAWPKEELAAALDTVCQADKQADWKLCRSWGTNPDFLADIDQHAGLLGQRDGSRAPWRFLHRSFREYLAARALARREVGVRLALLDAVEGEKKPDAVQRFAIRWGEVLGMLCGLVPPREGEEHLDRLCQRAPQVALRALPAMDHLSPTRRVEVLARLASPGWREDELEAVAESLRAWGDSGWMTLGALVGDEGRPALERAVAAGLLGPDRKAAAVAALGTVGVALVDASRDGLGWLGARLVPRLVGLAPGEWLDLLLGLRKDWWGDWTADDLDDLLDAIGPSVEALWAEVRPDAEEARLGVLWFALERTGTGGQGADHAGWPALRQRFLAACGKDRPAPRQQWADIPGGSFRMGSPEGDGSDPERPQHEVHLAPFRMGTTPVTAAALAAFRGKRDRSTLPAVEVDWFTARLLAAWLGGRLPTEAEWEYACRAGTTTAYWSGDTEEDLARVGWYAGNSDDKPNPVGRKPSNPWGLHDMHGNVWEWCEDRFGPYTDASAADPAGPARGPSRVLRGGCKWLGPDWCRSASRSWFHPGSRSGDTGLRVVLPARSPAG